MEDPIWKWIEFTWIEGADVRGAELFWNGSTIWVLAVSFLLVNLLIYLSIFHRSLKRAAPDCVDR